MKNIGILVYDISLTGGAEKVAIKLSESLSSTFNVHMISIFDEKNFKQKSNRVNYYVISKKTKIITSHIILLSNALKRYLKNNSIDILFAITAGVNTVALLASLGLKTKVVYCEHSNLENKSYGKKHELRQFLGAKYSDKIVTLTERDKTNFINKYDIPKDKVWVIPNWFDLSIKEVKYNQKSKKIISVGRLEQVKGYDMLVDVAQKVFKKHPDWHWDIYGEGSYHEKIQGWIEDRNLKTFVTLKGNSNNLQDIYNNYSFFVMTSYYEGLPLSLLEAQSFKLPIVSFDSPTGPAEIVLNDENGYIVPTYDIEEMSKKIIFLIESLDTRINFSKKSQNNLKKYSKDEILSKWYELIKLLCGGI